MKQKIQITIPEPCQEGWQNMTPVKKGRFCASCQKTVLDFTHLSDNEIINLVSKNDALCGRINVSQLNRNLIETKTKFNYFGYVATSVLAFLGLGTSTVVAQEKPIVEQTDLKYLNKVSDSVKRITVTGVVTDYEGKPLRDVSVSIKGSNDYVLTDKNGKYSLEVKKGKKLVFSRLNFEEKIIRVKLVNINLQLKKEEMLIGAVIIE